MSINTLGPSFQIDLSNLIRNSDLICDEEDSRQVANVVKRHMSALKKVSSVSLSPKHIMRYFGFCTSLLAVPDL